MMFPSRKRADLFVVHYKIFGSLSSGFHKSMHLQHPHGLLCIPSVELGGKGNQFKCDVHAACCAVRNCLLSDPGTLGLLPASIKYGGLTCKLASRVKISAPSQFLTVYLSVTSEEIVFFA